MIANMKWIWPVLAAVTLGCAQKPATEGIEHSRDAKSVSYSDLEKHVGEKVKTAAWVLGEGQSYKFEGKFIFALVPSPQVDWPSFFLDWDEIDALVKTLEGDPDRRAETRDVEKYMKLQKAIDAWSGQIKSLEESENCNAWGHFKQSVLTAEYAYIGDAPLILVSPTRKDLKAAADKVFARYQQIEKSCELEIVGVVRNIGDWAQDNRVNTSLGPMLGTKKMVIEVESYKVLQTARGAAAGGKMGITGVEKAQVEGGQ